LANAETICGPIAGSLDDGFNYDIEMELPANSSWGWRSIDGMKFVTIAPQSLKLEQQIKMIIDNAEASTGYKKSMVNVCLQGEKTPPPDPLLEDDGDVVATSSEFKAASVSRK